MPSQNRVRRDDRGDLAQRLAPESLSTHGQPTSLIIGEPEPAAAQLAPQDSILFHQIRHDVLLVPIEPAGESGQKN